MNLYILVEGKTERKVYPEWISHLLPEFVQIYSPKDVVNNNFYLISGGGYPSILDNRVVNLKKHINIIYLHYGIFLKKLVSY